MKKHLIIVALFSLSLNIMTSSLGSMSVTSSLNENLEATITVNLDRTFNLSNISLEKSQKEFIKNAQILDVSELILDTVTNANGNQSISLTTSKPVKDEHYDFNVIVDLGNSAIRKRYFGFIPKSKNLKQDHKTQKNKVVVNDLSSCLDLGNSQARLECYDKSLSRETGSNDERFDDNSNNKKNLSAVAKNVVKEEYFGKRGEDLQESIARTQKVIIPKEMSSVIEKIKRYAAEKYILTLKNEQKWKVLEPTRKGLFKKDQSVSITKGLFGSYNLSIENQNKKYKVKREK